MQKPSLDQLLAIIPPQGQQTLDQKISDIHLAEIASTLTNWESVCSNLGITEPEEEAIREENARADARRYVVLLPFRWGCLVSIFTVIVYMSRDREGVLGSSQLQVATARQINLVWEAYKQKSMCRLDMNTLELVFTELNCCNTNLGLMSWKVMVFWLHFRYWDNLDAGV